MNSLLLDDSCRVALAAMLHDLGKFAERARLQSAELETFKQLDCPHWDGRPTHIHAAYTTAGWLQIESYLPPKEMLLLKTPFARAGTEEVDDSLINAAARHHRPDTLLQWIVAVADRLASGFERSEFEHYNCAVEGTATGKNHYQARLLALFEHISPQGPCRQESPRYCLPLRALAPETIFPCLRSDAEPRDDATAQREYAELWQQFVMALESIPAAHRQNLPLWLDHFDAAWLTYTHAIPSATAGKMRPDVSLYDHSKTTAALATALWRWIHDTGTDPDTILPNLRQFHEWTDAPFLLVQGDFSGIQEFIFAEGSQVQKAAARILRGSSFQVSLLTELAALRVLQALALPSTSQVINAAGKFLIVAPNTDEVQRRLADVQRELDAWFLEHTFGESSLQIVALPATCPDFTPSRYPELIAKLFAKLQLAKRQRFALCAASAPDPLRAADYTLGVCAFDGRRPAQFTNDDGLAISHLAHDQITIGKYLADPAFDRLIVARAEADLWQSGQVEPLTLTYFGYRVAFVKSSAGVFGELARSGQLLRYLDISLPSSASTAIFAGIARRDLNAFVPIENGHIVTLETLAVRPPHHPDKLAPKICNADQTTVDSVSPNDTQANGIASGLEALAVLKGDVDQLGALFQNGIHPPSFARMAMLSRLMNAFFSLYLPWLCRTRYSDTYTVFAGGDDFFLIGPWYQTQWLALEMRTAFHRFVAANERITFSAGIVFSKPERPIRHLARQAEEALEAAKAAGRNRLATHGQVVLWKEADELMRFEQWLDTPLPSQPRFVGLSSAFVYGLLTLAEMANSRRPQDALWRSWLAYRVRRNLVGPLHLSEKEALEAQVALAGTLERVLTTHKVAARIAFENFLYRRRERRV